MTAAATDDDLDVETEGETEGEDDGKEYVPPTEDEYKRLTERLAAVNAESKKHRLAARKARDDAEAAAAGKAKGKPDGKDDDDEKVDVEAVQREAAKKTAAEWKPRLVRSAAKAALVEAGLKGSPDKMLRLIDVDDCEVDDDGEVTGISDQVDDLKEDYPELFGKRADGRRARGDVGDKPDGAGSSKLSASERQARALLRR